MACGGCRGGNGDLTKVAFLTPRQMRIKKKQLEQLEKDAKNKKG